MVFPYREKTAKFCSKACWSKRAGERICAECGKPFRPVSGGVQHFCSKRCSSGRRGAKSPAWRGGVTLENARARISNPIKEWRRSVFKRDQFRCFVCNADEDIQAHHIKEFSAHPELRLDVANGVTLCIECHGALHWKDFRRSLRKSCVACAAPLSRRTKGNECRSCVLERGASLSLQRRFARLIPEQPSGQ